MISVIIPSSQDPFLQKTIDSLLENAQGEIEVIPVLDGFIPDIPLKLDARVKPVDLPLNYSGMRAAFNAGLAKAKGEFIMKSDSHCAYGPGYDIILTENCAEDWLVIPRRYSLDTDNWYLNDTRPIRDYHFLSFPLQSGYGTHLSNQEWPQRGKERQDSKYDVDDTMTFQGSCWLANKKYFIDHVGPLDDRKRTYGPFADEPQEVGLKYWLGGGMNKVIKKTWYAHLNKRPHHYRAGLFNRDYKKDTLAIHGHTWSAKHWFENKEPGMMHPFAWLVERFWPVPYWPEDRNLWVFPKPAS